MVISTFKLLYIISFMKNKKHISFSNFVYSNFLGKIMNKISRVEIHEFTHIANNLGLLTNANTIGAVGYAKDQSIKLDKYAIVIETKDGCRGEYVTHWGGNQVACAQSKMLAPKLLDYNADEREKIYDDFKRELRQFDHMGHGPLDIALWDWAGKI